MSPFGDSLTHPLYSWGDPCQACMKPLCSESPPVAPSCQGPQPTCPPAPPPGAHAPCPCSSGSLTCSPPVGPNAQPASKLSLSLALLPAGGLGELVSFSLTRPFSRSFAWPGLSHSMFTASLSWSRSRRRPMVPVSKCRRPGPGPEFSREFMESAFTSCTQIPQSLPPTNGAGPQCPREGPPSPMGVTSN